MFEFLRTNFNFRGLIFNFWGAKNFLKQNSQITVYLLINYFRKFSYYYCAVFFLNKNILKAFPKKRVFIN